MRINSWAFIAIVLGVLSLSVYFYPSLLTTNTFAIASYSASVPSNSPFAYTMGSGRELYSFTSDTTDEIIDVGFLTDLRWVNQNWETSADGIPLTQLGSYRPDNSAQFAEWDKLVASGGKLDAPYVRILPEGDYKLTAYGRKWRVEILDGIHRIEWARSRGITEIPVVVDWQSGYSSSVSKDYPWFTYVLDRDYTYLASGAHADVYLSRSGKEIVKVAHSASVSPFSGSSVEASAAQRESLAARFGVVGERDVNGEVFFDHFFDFYDKTKVAAGTEADLAKYAPIADISLPSSAKSLSGFTLLEQPVATSGFIASSEADGVAGLKKVLGLQEELFNKGYSMADWSGNFFTYNGRLVIGDFDSLLPVTPGTSELWVNAEKVLRSAGYTDSVEISRIITTTSKDLVSGKVITQAGYTTFSRTFETAVSKTESGSAEVVTKTSSVVDEGIGRSLTLGERLVSFVRGRFVYITMGLLLLIGGYWYSRKK